ncbi:MAG TPA: hypothetical protein VLZ74_14880 [Methylocella sp.]|nr:hypothetical protein [Methylocella sp.]
MSLTLFSASAISGGQPAVAQYIGLGPFGVYLGGHRHYGGYYRHYYHHSYHHSYHRSYRYGHRHHGGGHGHHGHGGSAPMSPL